MATGTPGPQGLHGPQINIFLWVFKRRNVFGCRLLVSKNLPLQAIYSFPPAKIIEEEEKKLVGKGFRAATFHHARFSLLTPQNRKGNKLSALLVANFTFSLTSDTSEIARPILEKKRNAKLEMITLFTDCYTFLLPLVLRIGWQFKKTSPI